MAGNPANAMRTCAALTLAAMLVVPFPEAVQAREGGQEKDASTAVAPEHLPPPMQLSIPSITLTGNPENPFGLPPGMDGTRNPDTIFNRSQPSFSLPFSSDEPPQSPQEDISNKEACAREHLSRNDDGPPSERAECQALGIPPSWF
ncbi:hypothetical protein MNR01_10690 [Lysobacter sp. S4-A87]|uniref:hypothetical protein n=1 Tax=Lysobacter sp. S4-A87 TaxID=2925843 RepID=UPI001F531CB6|nr:hypothetical protein [Lysobacter sp. S4-A87]UNK48241.1 hypothetical protein MNR01_10690 [Lysobacter sp. S4-A87]